MSLKSLSPELKKIMGNTAWLFSDRLLQLGLGVVVGVWVARYLGPTDFGLYNYIIAMVSLFTPLAKLGLDNIIVRDIAKDINRKDSTLGTGLMLRIVASVVAAIAVWLTVFALNPESNQTHLLVGIFAIASGFRSFDVIEYWFQSQVQAKYMVWARNAVYITINVLKVWMIQMQAPLIVFVGILSLEQIFTALGLICAYHWQGNRIWRWRVQRQRAKTLLNDSWPLILSGIVIIIYMRIDQVMLERMVGLESVGLYSAAVKISEMWYFVPISIVNSVFPSVVQAKDLGEAVYRGRIQKLFNFMTLVGYGVAIPMTFLAPFCVYLLYGPNFEAAATVLTIHIWAGVFVSLGVARETWLTTEGLMRFSAATTAVGAAVNVVLNWFLIPKYGGSGAAIATVAAQIFASYIAGAFYAETRSIFWSQTQALFLIGWLRRET
ncbi:MAG: flippase [Spirulina sp. SIO3F2]|nr:flippase [Spirulina sp. SIO3F2]